MDIDSQLIKVSANCQIEVRVIGFGRDIVLLPSLGRGVEDFEEMLAPLCAAGFRVILPQPRGIGASIGPLEDITLSDLAADVAAVVTKLCRGPAIIAGHAFGNFVARMVAARHPEITQGVALLAASPGWVPPGETLFEPEVHASIFSSGDLSLDVEKRREHLMRAFFAPGNDPDIWLDGWYPIVKSAQAAAQRATPVSDYLSAGNVAPVLHIQAANDTVAPARFQPLFEQIIGTQRLTSMWVENAGHALLPEQPEQVVACLVSWVSDHVGRHKTAQMQGAHS